MIELVNVNRVFETRTLRTSAIRNVNVEISDNDFLAIVGPSGSGKTTLLNVIGLLDTPTSGEVKINGESVGAAGDVQLAKLRNKHFGFVFQNFNLLDDLTVLENVQVPLRIANEYTRPQIEQMCVEMLDRVDLGPRANHYPSELSGGQQQRVAIARAVAHKPAWILADEPTGNLDSKSSEEVMSLLRDLHQGGAGIIMVTHSEASLEYANVCMRMLDGTLTPLPNHIGGLHVAGTQSPVLEVSVPAV